MPFATRHYRIKLLPEANTAVVEQLQRMIVGEGGHIIKQGKGAFSAHLTHPLVVYLRNHSYVDDVSLMPA